MRLAWAASMLAQALLLASTIRASRLDLWTAFLAADLIRSCLLWRFSPLSASYYYIWTIGQLPLLLLQIASCASKSERKPGAVTWIYGALACSAWVVAISPIEWPLGRQASIMVWHFGSVVCLSTLVYGQWRDFGMLCYFALQSALSAIALMNTSRVWAEAVGTVQCVSVAVLFSVWALEIHIMEARRNGGK